MDLSIVEDEKEIIQAKIIALAVSASAKPENHKSLIETGFYAQFKRNINDEHKKIV